MKDLKLQDSSDKELVSCPRSQAQLAAAWLGDSTRQPSHPSACEPGSTACLPPGDRARELGTPGCRLRRQCRGTEIPYRTRELPRAGLLRHHRPGGCQRSGPRDLRLGRLRHGQAERELRHRARGGQRLLRRGVPGHLPGDRRGGERLCRLRCQLDRPTVWRWLQPGWAQQTAAQRSRQLACPLACRASPGLLLLEHGGLRTPGCSHLM